MGNLKKFYDYYDMEISACKGSKHAEFIQSIKADLKPCDVVSVRELFTEEQIRIMKTLVEPKQCFMNAFRIADILRHPDSRIQYVEGRVLVANFLPIEHAWNKVGDKFFDVTFELILGYDVTKEAYAVMAEYGVDYVRGVLLERGYWGGIYFDEKRKEFYGHKTKSRRNTFQHQ
jgi:hypothetical protein